MRIERVGSILEDDLHGVDALSGLVEVVPQVHHC
jgi:hypothetical protein